MLIQHTALFFSFAKSMRPRVKFLLKARAKEARNHIKFIACGALLDIKKKNHLEPDILKNVSRLAGDFVPLPISLPSSPNL